MNEPSGNRDKTPKIRVLVRKRPLSKKEQLKNEEDIIEVENSQSVIVREQKYKVDLTPYIDEYRFNFDGAYDELATNQQIYLTSVRPLVDCAFDGARVSCFAYGQTGSGKTYTMLGDSSQGVRGLYLLAAYDLFEQIDSTQLSVWISFYEIYCGKLYDLLNDRNLLYARQDAKNNVNIVGLSQRKIVSVDNLMQIIQFGTGVRVTAQNGTNVDSSRSHAILQITLKNSNNKIHGKVSFIDLAGSERAADHADQLQKQTRIDGAEINKSLLALKQCIRALDQNKNHTPFRGSKLTMVLKDSFTGYCRTVMIGNISPNSSSCQNTLNTLKYADRVKQLKRPGMGGLHQQMMMVDSMSRELMLPRALTNNTRKFQDGNGGNSQPLHPHNYQKQSNNSRNERIQSSGNSYKSNPKYTPNQQPPLFTKSNHHSHNPHRPSMPVYGSQSNHHSSPYAKEYDQPQIPPQPYQQQQHKSYANKLIQQEEPHFRDYGKQRIDSVGQLQQKHSQYIQLIIQEQEDLMKSHEQHINTSIQLVKQEMFLMAEADKIGSNIEDYLNNLQGVLELQLNSIYQVRDKVRKMKADLRESKRIEQLYIQQTQNQHENILLDDDDNLF